MLLNFFCVLLFSPVYSILSECLCQCRIYYHWAEVVQLRAVEQISQWQGKSDKGRLLYFSIGHVCFQKNWKVEWGHKKGEHRESYIETPPAKPIRSVKFLFFFCIEQPSTISNAIPQFAVESPLGFKNVT